METDRVPDVRPKTLPFEEFFSAEYRRLFQAMYLVCRSRSDAEDLAQEAMARAYERWDRLASTASPSGYVYRTAFNLNRKRLRRLRTARAKDIVEAAPADPTSEVERRLEIVRLMRALPRSQQHALLLVEWLGLNSEEAAEILGIQPSSVRGRVHRAREALLTRLGDIDE